MGGRNIRDLRDHALLLVAFWGALRRSEIASLDITGRSPVTIEANGMVLHLTGTKSSSATAGAPEHVIQRTTRQKSADVLRAYIRGLDAIEEGAAAYLR